MSLAYIRSHYNVPAFRGRQICYNGRRGRITACSGSGPHLLVHLEGTPKRRRVVLHPTDGVGYAVRDGTPVWKSQPCDGCHLRFPIQVPSVLTIINCGVFCAGCVKPAKAGKIRTDLTDRRPA